MLDCDRVCVVCEEMLLQRIIAEDPKRELRIYSTETMRGAMSFMRSRQRREGGVKAHEFQNHFANVLA